LVALGFKPGEKDEKENRPRDKEEQGVDMLSDGIEIAFKNEIVKF